MAKVVKLNPKYIEEAKAILADMPEKDMQSIGKYLAERFLEEVKQGVSGEVARDDAPFFDLVDRIYEESASKKGCYFCDDSIDGNETPFDFPSKTKLCLNCMLKVANLLKAFGIDHRVLFPGMGDRKAQAVIFSETQPN